jgi:hypothetical protein
MKSIQLATAQVELTKLLYDSQAMFIFNEKHHIVAGSKNYKEDKPMQMAQVPHCKLVVYDELIEETRHVSLGSLAGDPYEQHHK